MRALLRVSNRTGGAVMLFYLMDFVRGLTVALEFVPPKKKGLPKNIGESNRNVISTKTQIPPKLCTSAGFD